MFTYSQDGTIVRPQQKQMQQQMQQQIRQKVQQPMLSNKKDSKDSNNCWLTCLFWIFLILLVIAVFLCFNNNKKEEVRPSFGYYF
jgi:ATP-dependent Zn protease